MIMLTVWQLLELVTGGMCLAAFLVLVVLLRLSKRRGVEPTSSGCAVLILLPLAIIGIYLVCSTLVAL